jgi:hypothetical protein
MWNPDQHSDEDNLRWTLLRAIEWDAWPFFISQPIVPVLLYSFVWWEIIIALMLIQFAWAVFIRNTFVSVWLAASGAIFVRLKWVICPIIAYKLFVQGQIVFGRVRSSLAFAYVAHSADFVASDGNFIDAFPY